MTGKKYVNASGKEPNAIEAEFIQKYNSARDDDERALYDKLLSKTLHKVPANGRANTPLEHLKPTPE